MHIDSIEFFKCVIIFILLYNFETIISSLCNLFVEYMNYLISMISLKLIQKKNEIEDESNNVLEPCIGFQVPSEEEEDYD